MPAGERRFTVRADLQAETTLNIVSSRSAARHESTLERAQILTIRVRRMFIHVHPRIPTFLPFHVYLVCHVVAATTTARLPAAFPSQCPSCPPHPAIHAIFVHSTNTHKPAMYFRRSAAAAPTTAPIICCLTRETTGVRATPAAYGLKGCI